MHRHREGAPPGAPSASIEWCPCGCMGCLRAHPEGGDYAAHSPYGWSCTVRREGAVAVLIGVDKGPSPSQLHAADDALRLAGFALRRYERVGSDGSIRVMTRRLKPPGDSP